MTTIPRYRVTAADGRAAFQLHVKSVIVSRTVERRDLYEYLNQSDFQQHVSDAFRRAEEEIRSANGLVLEDFKGIRYRAGSIIVLKSYVAHFPTAQHFNVFFYDTDRNIRDIEEIIDTKLRAELSYIDNISIATSAYATLGLIEAEALPSTAAASYAEAAEATQAAAAAAAAETAASPEVATAETGPQTAAGAEPAQSPTPRDTTEAIVDWVNRAIAAILIALLLGAIIWYLVNNASTSPLSPTRATDVPYKDIEIPGGAGRRTTADAHPSSSCDMPKTEAGSGVQASDSNNCSAR
jgi:hypothetical protein